MSDLLRPRRVSQRSRSLKIPRSSRRPHRVLLVLLRPEARRASAPRYPSKPIRIVVPFSAGGGVDIAARTIGWELAEAWEHPIVVENRPGQGGSIGTAMVAKAPPDGYTLLMTTCGHAIRASLCHRLPYDPVKDFAPITQLTSNAFLVLVVNPSVPTPSLKDLVTLAKGQRPGSLKYGSTGLGAPPHLTMELMKMMAGIDMVHIPYPGDAPLTSALLSGEVQAAFVPLAGALPHLRSGRLRALGITSSQRSPVIPAVPSIAEAGIPGFEFSGWLGLFAPAGTPREIVNKLYGELAEIVGSPYMAASVLNWGHRAAGSTPDEFAAKLRAEITNYANVIKEAGIPQVGLTGSDDRHDAA